MQAGEVDDHVRAARPRNRDGAEHVAECVAQLACCIAAGLRLMPRRGHVAAFGIVEPLFDEVGEGFEGGGREVVEGERFAPMRRNPLVERIGWRSAEGERNDVPAGLVAGVDGTLRAQGAGDRLEEVLEELDRIRAEVGWPPLAAPIGQVLASQALINVLAASRYITIVDELRALVTGTFGEPPEPIDPAVRRAVELTHDPETTEDVVARSP